MNLPDEIAGALQPLFDTVPIETAMPHLLGSHPHHSALVEQVLQHPALAGRDHLAAGLWLYVDDLERSHTLSQSLEDPAGSFWHGIVHRREGDFSNSRYWHRRAAGHPLLAANLEGLVSDVERARGEDVPALVAKQREEWQTLFEWCAASR